MLREIVLLAGLAVLGGEPVEVQPPAQGSADETAIRQTAEKFTAAFNRGDAPAVAALWTDNGEYVSTEGQRFLGREAIQKSYVDFFAENPDARITLTVDSIRLLNEITAIENGMATVLSGPYGLPAVSRYTVVHVKQDGRWLVAVAHETPEGSVGDGNPLVDFEWLIGSWTTVSGETRIDMTCRWIADKAFIQRSFTVRAGDDVASSGVQIIGWDPAAEQVTSWTFDSTGGFSVGVWTPQDTGWMIQAEGVLGDGTPTSATNLLSRTDDDVLSWKSVDRVAGDVQLPDTPETIIRRNK